MREENRSTHGETSKSKVENQRTQLSWHAESGNRTWATSVEGECPHHGTNRRSLRDARDNRTQLIVLCIGILLETFIWQVTTEFGDTKRGGKIHAHARDAEDTRGEQKRRIKFGNGTPYVP